MHDDADNTSPFDHRRERNSALARPESAGAALHRELGPVITMDAVQRYVETERVRARRALFWTSAFFLLVISVVLALFVTVGIIVLRSSREAREIAGDMQAQTAVYAAEVVGMSDRVGRIEGGQNRIKEEVAEVETRRLGEKRVLQSDLERFSRWVASQSEERSRALTMLETRLRDLEEVAAARQRELLEIKQKYRDLQAAVAAGTAGKAPAGGGPRPAGGADAEPAGGGEVRPDGDAPETGLARAMPGEPALAAPRGEVSVVTFANGDRYEGEFKDGLFHGWGVYYYRNGDRYEGDFRNDMKHGKGTLIFHNGDKYTGEFENDMMHGRGTFLFANGDRYVGEFYNDMISGKGTRFYKNGNKYSGDFRNGRKHGNGRFEYANGDAYTGEFRDGRRHGRGTYLFSNGARYEGEFVDGRRHGQGKYVYASGEEYVGEFKHGLKDGVGVCLYPDGTRVRGTWKEDRLATVIEE